MDIQVTEDIMRIIESNEESLSESQELPYSYLGRIDNLEYITHDDEPRKRKAALVKL